MDEAAELKVFTAQVGRREVEWNLAEVALGIARHEYPCLDIAAYMDRMAHMGQEVKRRIVAGDTPREIVQKINQYLFTEERFHGNEEEYYDPKNSFLNDVLDRKIGIPITLSILYMGVAEAIPFPLQGIGFPGHFLIRFVSDCEELLIDPFHKGNILAVPDCQDLLDNVYEGAIEFRPEFLQPVTKRQIIKRMLSNLKGIYLRTEAYPKALAIVERLLCLEPNTAEEIRDRGVLHYRLHNYGKALSDLEKYVRLAPNAQDRETVQENIQMLRRLVASLN